jgi:NAD(P)-dependent dehydrogenase (short-subunit alcohol dehydrogenase family)
MPTAVHAVADAHETPAKGMPSVPSPGVGRMAHLFPFHRSAIASPPLDVPTAAQRLDPQTLQMPASGYKGATAYARAKRAQVALSREWARRLDGAEVTFHAMHPGWADTPGLAAALPGFHRVMGSILRSPQQGADTVIWLASTDAGRLGSGQFWHDRRPRSEYLLPWTRESSPAIAGQLWECIAGPSGLDDPESLGSSTTAPD